MPIDKKTRWLLATGQNDHLPILVKGMPHAPLVRPYCRICGCPTEQYTRVVPKDDVLEIDAHCCGKQMGRRITIEELRRIHATNEKLWLVVGRHQTQSIERHGGRIMVGGKRFKVEKRKVAAGK